jgi:hypothetical protein
MEYLGLLMDMEFKTDDEPGFPPVLPGEKSALIENWEIFDAGGPNEK